MTINKLLGTILLSAATLIVANAQTFDESQKIPVDTAITIGKLPNGLTYYIKKNAKPENRMELRLAVNAGSILEEDGQQGLAHFTEHMAFNGTKNFAKNDLISYLQTMGIRFGADLNAYTSFDETVYMLLLPTNNKELMDKGFQVLQDWAGGITFDSLEIEKERGVVREEWRIGRGADQRMLDKYLPVLFHKSQYANRLPIGKIEVIDSFKRETILRFFNDWYRPDLMAIVAVGDFDKAEVEKKIKEYFSILKNPDKPKARKTYPVPGHKETLYSICSDKEANMTTVSVYHKTDHKKETTIGDYRESVKRLLYFAMLNQRVEEITRNPQPPFINAYSFYGNMGARSKYAYAFAALVSDTGIKSGLKALLIENEKVKKFGFTPGEIERAKKEVLAMYEQYYNERDKSESEQFAAEFIRNFLTSEPIPGISFEYNYVKHTLPSISIDEVNLLAHKWITDSNRVVIVTAPEKENVKLITEAELKSVLDSMKLYQLEAYTDYKASENLLNQQPLAGSIKETEELKEIGSTIFTLSNGIKVLLKPSDFKNDEILVSAVSFGGQSLYPDNDHYSASFATNIIKESGVGEFSIMDLQKNLAGKTVTVNPYINMYTEGIKASCAPRDMKTMFELIYLYFTNPRVDEQAFASWKARMQSYLKDIASDPDIYYSDQFARTMSQNHLRSAGVPKPSDLDKIQLNRVLEIYKDRFSNASDFVFTIVGNFNPDSIKPFLETYLASLHSKNSIERWRDLGIRPPQGDVYKEVVKGKDPRSTVSMVYTDTITYSKDKAYILNAFADYLDIRLIEVLREEQSGVYGVGASAQMSRTPYQNYNITVRFPCAPENTDSLSNLAANIFFEACQNGVSEVNVNKIKETQHRELEVSLKNNSFWLTNLENALLYNEDLTEINQKKEKIDRLTPQSMQQAACTYNKKDIIKVVLKPEK